jgi:hypothetical protein
MTDEIYQVLGGLIEPNLCYSNSLDAMYALGAEEVTYVVGRADSYIPVDHAWIKYGGIYYDPTWEMYSDLSENYYPIAELDVFQLVTIADDNRDYPPTAMDMLINFPEQCLKPLMEIFDYGYQEKAM